MIYYMIQNFVTGQLEFTTNEEEANRISAENKQAWLEQEAYRFTVNRVVVEGNNTTWTTANIDTDPEEGLYCVFNTFTGQHEEISSKTQAWTRLDQIKNDFIAQYYPQPYQIISEAQYNRLVSNPSYGIPLTEL